MLLVFRLTTTKDTMTFATDFLKRLQNRIELIKAIEAEDKSSQNHYACRFDLQLYGEPVDSDIENGILCSRESDDFQIDLSGLIRLSDEYIDQQFYLRELLVFGVWRVCVTQTHETGFCAETYDLDDFTHLDDISEQFRQDTGIAAYEYKFEQQYDRPDRD